MKSWGGSRLPPVLSGFCVLLMCLFGAFQGFLGAGGFETRAYISSSRLCDEESWAPWKANKPDGEPVYLIRGRS